MQTMPTFIHKPPKKKGKNESDSAMKKKKKNNLPPIKVHVFCKDKQTNENKSKLKRDGKNKQKLYAETCIRNSTLSAPHTFPAGSAGIVAHYTRPAMNVKVCSLQLHAMSCEKYIL